MHKQPGSKYKKKIKPTEHLTTRSTTHYHTRAELDRIERDARERGGGGRDQSTGFALQRDDGSFEVRDDLAEQLTEEFLISALSGEETHKILEDDTDEETLGPVMETSGSLVFGDSDDEMNSAETLRESLPTAGSWTLTRHGRVS